MHPNLRWVGPIAQISMMFSRSEGELAAP